MFIKNLVASFNQQPKWWRITTYLSVAYLLYALALGLLIPIALESIAPKHLSQTLGRHVDIEKVSINPFLLRARVFGFSVEEADKNQPFIAIAQLDVDMGFWQTLFYLTPTIEHVYIKKPYTHLARTSGGNKGGAASQNGTRFNFSDIIETLAKNASERPEGETKSPQEIPHIRLGEFRVDSGRVVFSDNVTDTRLDYPELSFALINLDTQASVQSDSDILNKSKSDNEKADNQYDFTLSTTEGGKLHLDGQFQLSPLNIRGTLALNKIALAPLWPLSDDVIDAKITAGALDLTLHYQLSDEADDLRFQAKNAAMTVSELAISNNNTPSIFIGDLSINDVFVDTREQRVDIAQVRISDPWVRTSINNESVNLVSMFTPKGLPSESPASAPQSHLEGDAPWRIVTQAFELTNGDVSLHEAIASNGVHWRVFPLNLSTGPIDSNLKLPIDYILHSQFDGALEQPPSSPTSMLRSQGVINAHDHDIEGSIDISQFALAQIQPYLQPYLNLSLKEGNASIAGSFKADTNNNVLFNGQANIASLTIIDGLKLEPLLKWDDMQLSGIQYNSATSTLSLQKITLDSPFTKLLISEEKQTNFGNLVVQHAPNPAHAKVHASSDQPPNENENSRQDNVSELSIRVNEVLVSDGSAYFADNSLRPRFASGIEGLHGSISKLSSNADTKAQVDLRGKIDGYAPVALTGKINPLIDNMFLDLSFTVDGAELTSVNPYSGTYMGHFIDKGLLSLDIQYSLENNQLLGNNHLVIDQLTLGRKTDSDQALSLPLELAIALLEDPDGVIDLGLQVSGDLGNPRFGFGSIILKAITNVLTKAITAPFSLLANLVGSDAQELNEIAFSHGSAELSDTASEKLQILAEALAKRPGLRVNIEGTVNEVSDAYQLAEQKLQRQLLTLSAQTSLPEHFSPSEMPLSEPLVDALTSLFTRTTSKTMIEERQVVKAKFQQEDAERVIPDAQLEQALHVAMYNQIRNTIKIPEHELAHLADKRAKAVKTFLANHNNIDANRLFLLNSRQHLQLKKSGVALTLDAD